MGRGTWPSTRASRARWRRGRRVSFLATANVGAGYTGADDLDHAFLNRYGVVIDLGFPPPGKELAILRRRCPTADAAATERLVKLADHQRKLAGDGEFVASISTRSLLTAAELTARGVTWEAAVGATVVNRFPADGGDVSERAKMLQLVQKHGRPRK